MERISGLFRDLAFYSYPPAHWAELAIPRLFQGLPGGPEGPYWLSLQTTGYEACLYVGTLPLILAFVGACARRDRALAPWRLIILTSLALATMPAWWPGGYELLTHLPGLRYFRAPGRYTLLASLGLALLAGRGFDRSLGQRQFRTGLLLAGGFAIAASIWALYWAHRPVYAAALGDEHVSRFLAPAAVAWTSALLVLVLWRRRVTGSIVPFVVAAIELAALYYHGTTVWGRSIDLPSGSPVLRRLAQERDVGTVAGYVDDLPVRANRAAAYPYLGVPPPMPTAALEFARDLLPASRPEGVRLLTHFGVTHGIWDAPVPVPGVEVLYRGEDQALDRLVYTPSPAPVRRHVVPGSVLRRVTGGLGGAAGSHRPGSPDPARPPGADRRS